MCLVVVPGVMTVRHLAEPADHPPCFSYPPTTRPRILEAVLPRRGNHPPRRTSTLTAQTADDRDPDPELAEYNDYLSGLNARSERAR